MTLNHLIDSHCHIVFSTFQDDLDEVAARWRAAGVKSLLHACVKPSEIPEIRKLADRFPELRILHFIDPAYFVKGRKKQKARMRAAQILKTIHSDDLVGLHLHGWKSIADAAQVEFRKEPTFWGNRIRLEDCVPDCGHEVSIASYTPEQLDRLLGISLKLFRLLKLPKPKFFMAGGWMASVPVLNAVMRAGILHDFSPLVFFKTPFVL